MASPLPQLDRLFDYSVPEEFGSSARLGARVRIRFAGRLTDGVILAERSVSEVERLTPLKAVKGPPVVTSELAELVTAVARRYVGSRSDVLRAAVPPRHRRAEISVLGDSGDPDDGRDGSDRGSLSDLAPAVAPVGSASHGKVSPGGTGERAGWAAWSRAVCDLRQRTRVRGSLVVPPAFLTTDRLLQAIAATLDSGRRVVVVLPDAKDVAEAYDAAVATFGRARCARLTADMGPAARYRSYLRALTGDIDVLIGTRACAFTPMPALGLLWLGEDAEDSLADPQAPYWHAREVVGMRADQTGASVVLAGRMRTPEVQRLVDLGWAGELSPDRAVWRGTGPTIRTPTELDLARDAMALSVRLPHAALALTRRALADGPVLVQVGSRGYLPVVACRRCREPASCPECLGALSLAGAQVDAACSRCGRVTVHWSCPHCGDGHLRAVRVGSTRTAEELSKALSGVPVITSDSDVGVVAEIGSTPALVVATPGAEPRAEGGYAAALLLDGDRALARPRLRAGEEVLLRWARAAALVRSGKQTGSVMIVANSGSPVVQAVVRADPIGWATNELAVRTQVGLPPARRMISLTGSEQAVEEFLTVAEQLTRAEGVDLGLPLGPVTVAADRFRWLLRIDHRQAASVVAVLWQLQVVRATAREPVVAVRVDPLDVD